MIDTDITDKISKISECVDTINILMAELHEKNVEVRIGYHDAKPDVAPNIHLWRAVEHVDYLKK